MSYRRRKDSGQWAMNARSKGWSAAIVRSAAWGLMHKLVEFRGREIGEWVHLGVAPDQLDGIEFGGVAGQQVGVDAVTMPREPSAHGSAAMRRQPVPDEIDGSAPATRELLEEAQNGLAVVIGIGQHPEIAAHPMPLGRDRERRDHRDLAPRPAALWEDRGHPARRPGAPHERAHQETRFVAEDERRPATGSVFFTRGHSPCTHRRIATASRSMARRAGFCGLKPNAYSSRPTWATW